VLSAPQAAPLQPVVRAAACPEPPGRKPPDMKVGCSQPSVYVVVVFVVIMNNMVEIMVYLYHESISKTIQKHDVFVMFYNG
jgi:hypothetical protein